MSSLIICSIIVACTSLAGSIAARWLAVSHTRMQLMMSFVSGLMIAAATTHLVPHSIVETQDLELSAEATLAGMVATFLLIRFLAVHQHGHHDPQGHHDGDGHSCEHDESHAHVVESIAHDHSEKVAASPERHSTLPWAWLPLLVGFSIHSLIDGAALAAALDPNGKQLFLGSIHGLGTFLAIALHKPLDAVAVTAVMLSARCRPQIVWGTAIVYALLTPLGALITWYGSALLPIDHQTAMGIVLAFTAGSFLCISLADLLPEIQFHSHDRLKLTAALLMGIASAWLLGVAEHGAGDAHQHNLPPTQHDHE